MIKTDAKIRTLRKKKKKMAKVQRRRRYKRFPLSRLKLELALAANSDQYMKTLYIIGNGFDLWHGLPTSCGEFYEFAKNTLDELENYYSFELHEHEPWHDFENALGAFSWENFFDFHNEVDIYAEDFRPKEIYGLEDELAEQTDIHVSTVKEAFVGWVNQIDVKLTQPQMKFIKDSQFITFNYTSTLQSVYKIEDDQVFHIHGRAEINDDLIFGHGENVVEPLELDDDGEITSSMFSDAEEVARYPLTALKKPVKGILKQNKSYFEQLSDVFEILIIGHSLNTIDQPYFRCVAHNAVNARWKVFCYTEEERDGHVLSLTNCGISQDKIEVCTYADL